MMKLYLVAILAVAGSCLANPKRTDMAEGEGKEALVEIVRKYTSNLIDSKYEAKVTKVLSVQQEQSWRYPYFLEFELSDSTCLKGSAQAKKIDQCALRSGAKVYQCRAKLFVTIWLQVYQVVDAVCHEK
ncbi:hypothetical protein HDE_12899 [Halotydeus destructor]|nr:hypothetical protein HDE_12899 [Halotydeus destructor]